MRKEIHMLICYEKGVDDGSRYELLNCVVVDFILKLSELSPGVVFSTEWEV